MAAINPFTERHRIVNPQRFAGRWGELSLIFERLEAGKPVLVLGAPGIGKSSLLTHIMQSAAANLGDPEIYSFYANLQEASGASEVYRAINEALHNQGSSLAALEVAVLGADAPVLLCLDDVHAAILAGWGIRLLEELGRLARGGKLLLVAALNGAAPQLSERFATLKLGAFGPSEVRLMTESYLDETGISFAPVELRLLSDLSATHPAYLQRAAYYLFESKLNPTLDWRAAYLADVQERPVPGAPLPPEVFESGKSDAVENRAYDEAESETAANAPPPFEVARLDPVLLFSVPLLIAALLYLVTSNLVLTLAVAALGLLGMALLKRAT